MILKTIGIHEYGVNMSLELSSNGDLMKELMRRCDHGVISLSFNRVETDERSISHVERQWIGNSHVCFGLLTHIQDDIMKELRERETEL